MSISAMKYALDVLDNYVEDPRCEAHCVTAIHFLRQAIAEAEKQEPVHASDMTKKRVDETPKCKDDPDAPHGFDRNASHSADRYVCECENWEPDNAA